MTTQETPSAGLPVLQVPINFVPAKAGEALKFGQMTIRKMEDDFHTDKTFSKNSTNISTCQLSQDNRIGTAEFIIPTKHQWSPAALARDARRNLPRNKRHCPLPHNRPQRR